jgi:hypothetical protein
MVQFIEHFQEMAHVSGYSVESREQNHVEPVPAGICQKLVKARPFRFCTGNCVTIFAYDFVSTLFGKCRRLVVGTGTGALPVMEDLMREAKRRNIELLIVPTVRAIQVLERDSTQTNAVLHVTC